MTVNINENGKFVFTLDPEKADISKFKLDLKFGGDVSFQGFVDFTKTNSNGNFDFRMPNGSSTGMEAIKTPQGSGFTITIQRKF